MIDLHPGSLYIIRGGGLATRTGLAYPNPISSHHGREQHFWAPMNGTDIFVSWASTNHRYLDMGFGHARGIPGNTPALASPRYTKLGVAMPQWSLNCHPKVSPKSGSSYVISTVNMHWQVATPPKACTQCRLPHYDYIYIRAEISHHKLSLAQKAQSGAPHQQSERQMVMRAAHNIPQCHASGMRLKACGKLVRRLRQESSCVVSERS